MSVLPGKQTEIVIKYVSATTTDSMGVRAPTWAAKVSEYGVVEEVSGDEAIVGGQETVRATHRLYLPYTSAVAAASISAKMQAAFAGKTCEILWVSNPGLENHHLEIMVREIA